LGTTVATTTANITQAASAAGVVLTAGTNPSTSMVPLNFTVTVTGISGGTVPQDTVSFTDNNNPISSCTGVTLAPTTGTFTCANVVLAPGNHVIVANYGGDSNYLATSSPGLPQLVQDFMIASSPTGFVNVTQGYTNTNNPFSSEQIPMGVSTGPLPLTPGFVDSLTVDTCTVTPLAGQSAATVPTCSLGVGLGAGTVVTCTTDGKSCTIAGGSSGTNGVTVTITTTATTPLGLYDVSVKGTDQAVPTLSHYTHLTVNVVNNTASVNVLPGGSGSVTATLVAPGSSGSVTLSSATCLLTGSGQGIAPLPSEGVLLPAEGISCSISPPSLALNPAGTFTVAITTTATVALLERSRSGIFAAAWVGLPGLMLLGSLRRRRRARSAILQFLGLCLILVILMQGIGCGGGFTRPPTAQGTPTGVYQVLVQASGTYIDQNGVQQTTTYSAVVPVAVGH